MDRDPPVGRRPMSVGSGMSFSSGGHCVEQQLQTIFRINPAEISAVWPQFAEQRLIIRIHSLADDGDSEPWDRGLFGRNWLLVHYESTVVIAVRSPRSG